MRKDYNLAKRQYVIGGFIVIIAIIYVLRLFNLQVMEAKYKDFADSNAFLRKAVYPSRGIIYDRDGRLARIKERFSVPYPRQLKENIMARGWQLLHTAMPAYDGQIAKAVKRGDLVSVNHRTAGFLETYFDLLFAMNELTHPGEKRLIQICRERCRRLPAQCEEHLERLFGDLYQAPGRVAEDIAAIISELEQVDPWG